MARFSKKSGSSMTPAELEATRRPATPCRRVKAKGCSAVAYVYEAGPGRFVAQMFAGKRTKPDQWYRYATAERRAQAVEHYFAGIAARENREKERRAPHKYEVGHVLRSCWGYDQTNVEFFEVVEVVGPYSIKVRELGAIDVGGGNGGDSSRCAPALGKYVGEAKLCRAYGKDGVRIDDVRRAWLWDAKPVAYSWGH